jgi:HD superfamily phosphohydrolase
MIGMLFKNIGPERHSLISTTREKDEILGDLKEMELDADRMDELRTQLSS